jgi:23S rRNA (uridine2552-2'-O)-methyltransferase
MTKDLGGSGRGRTPVKVKKARGRTASSRQWLQRQLNDPYVAAARQKGYRSRAAFKLIELDSKYRFL